MNTSTSTLPPLATLGLSLTVGCTERLGATEPIAGIWDFTQDTTTINGEATTRIYPYTYTYDYPC